MSKEKAFAPWSYVNHSLKEKKKKCIVCTVCGLRFIVTDATTSHCAVQFTHVFNYISIFPKEKFIP